jgi:hypothetical protein
MKSATGAGAAARTRLPDEAGILWAIIRERCFSILNEAAEQYIARKEMHELMAYGKENASRLGRVPSDAVKFVREDRNNQSRGR